MPADGPVNVTRQSIYAAIPILDMYSAYHIKRLRVYLALMILAIVIPQTVIEIAVFGSFLDIGDTFAVLLHPESEKFHQGTYVVSWMVLGIALSVYLIRRWSMQWNRLNAGTGV